MSGGEGLLVTLACVVALPFLLYGMVTSYLASAHPWGSLGWAVLGIAGLLALWGLLGKAVPTGLQLAQKTVGKLHAEAGERARILSVAWILFAAAVALVLVLIIYGGVDTPTNQAH